MRGVELGRAEASRVVPGCWEWEGRAPGHSVGTGRRDREGIPKPQCQEVPLPPVWKKNSMSPLHTTLMLTILSVVKHYQQNTVVVMKDVIQWGLGRMSALAVICCIFTLSKTLSLERCRFWLRDIILKIVTTRGRHFNDYFGPESSPAGRGQLASRQFSWPPGGRASQQVCLGFRAGRPAGGLLG